MKWQENVRYTLLILLKKITKNVLSKNILIIMSLYRPMMIRIFLFFNRKLPILNFRTIPPEMHPDLLHATPARSAHDRWRSVHCHTSTIVYNTDLIFLCKCAMLLLMLFVNNCCHKNYTTSDGIPYYISSESCNHE